MRLSLTPSAARAFSLRAPITTETERSLFQRRLALTLLVVFALAFAFFVFQFLTILFVMGGTAGAFLGLPSTQVQLGTTSSALLASLYLRRGKPSPTVLGIADAATAIAVCVGWAMMIHVNGGAAAGETRIELVPLLAASYTLASRAALIPSTTARSALVGLASLAPLVPVTFLMRAGAPTHQAALGPAIYVAIWAGVGVACTATISHVIYGLHLQVRKASQLGQYQLEEKIGEGGMGVVYRAKHAMLRRPCAIKLLTGEAGNAAERFEREVQITARLTHPNTVIVFDYGRTPDGVFYYAMEYLDGITLEELVEELGPLPPHRVVHILAQVCGALDEAHANGLVHRDIKPANIMLTERGGVRDVVKVLDFGLVKQTENTDPGVSDISVSAILGTPHFMAPEAIVAPSTVDARTDLYAVGATAYYMLTGRHVFEGTNLVQVCSQHLHQAPAPPSTTCPDVPESLEKVVLACLAKSADDRPARAVELADMLASCALAPWTRDDAATWWASTGPKMKSGSRRRVRDRRKAALDQTPYLGDTVAVSLDGRGAA